MMNVSPDAGADDRSHETWDNVTWVDPLPDLSGITAGSLGAGAGYWDDEVGANLTANDFERINDHLVRLTLPAASGYDITTGGVEEYVTFTVDATMVNVPTNTTGNFTSGKFVIRVGAVLEVGTLTVTSKTVYDNTDGGIISFAAGSTIQLNGRPLIFEDCGVRIRGTRSNPTNVKFRNASGNALTAAEQVTISTNAGATTIPHVPQTASQIGDELSATGIWLLGSASPDWRGEEVTPKVLDFEVNSATNWSIPNTPTASGDQIVIWKFGEGKFLPSNMEQLTRQNLFGQIIPWSKSYVDSFGTPNNYKHQTAKFGDLYAPVTNQTRFIKFDGFGHVQFAGHASKQQYPSTIEFVSLGEQNIRTQLSSITHTISPDPGTAKTGRYPLHWHHMGDGTVGSWIEGVSGWGSHNHYLVPHSSNDMYFKDCTTAWTLTDSGSNPGAGSEHLWWDPGIAFPLNGTANSGQAVVNVKANVANPFHPAYVFEDYIPVNSVMYLSNDQGNTGEFLRLASADQYEATFTTNLVASYTGTASLFQNVTHGIRAHGCVFNGVFNRMANLNSPSRASNVLLGTTTNASSSLDNVITMYNGTATDGSGIHWTEESNAMPNVWVFNNIRIHNNKADGIFIWQNTPTNPHNQFNVYISDCGDAGIDQGAYVTKGYHNGGSDLNLHKFEIFRCGRGIAAHSTSQGITRGDNYGLSFENVYIHGGSGYSVDVQGHSVPPSVPALYLNCTYNSKVGNTPILWSDVGGLGTPHPGHIDWVGGNLNFSSPANNFAAGSRVTTLKTTLTQNVNPGDTVINVVDGTVASGNGRILVGGDYVSVVSSTATTITTNGVPNGHTAGDFVWSRSFMRLQDSATAPNQVWAVATDNEVKAIAPFYYPASEDDVGLVTSPSLVNSQLTSFGSTTSAPYTLNFTPTDGNYLLLTVVTNLRQSVAAAHANKPTISGGSLTWTWLGQTSNPTSTNNQLHIFGAEVSGSPGAFSGTVTLNGGASTGFVYVQELQDVEDADPTGATNNSTFRDGSIRIPLNAEITGLERRNSLIMAYLIEDGGMGVGGTLPAFWTHDKSGSTTGVGVFGAYRVNGNPPFLNWAWNSGGEWITNSRAFAIEIKGVAADAPTGEDQVPGPVTNVQVTGTLEGATVTWDAPSDVGSTAILNYEVHPIPNTKSDGTPIAVGFPTSTTYTFDQGTLEGGVTYRFLVIAVNQAGGGSSQSSSPEIIARDFGKYGIPFRRRMFRRRRN